MGPISRTVLAVVAFAVGCTGPSSPDLPSRPNTGAPPDTGESGGSWTPAADLAELVGRVLSGTVDPRDRPALEAFLTRVTAWDGPWRHTVRTATSEDGLAWTLDAAAVWERASVPEAVVAGDGRIRLYAVDGDLDRFLARALANDPVFRDRGLVGLAGLACRTSEDGVAFGPEEPLVVGVNPGVVVDPDVVLLPDGTWDLLYVGAEPGAFAEEATAPGGEIASWPQLARGPDGIAYTAHGEGDPIYRFLDPTHARETEDRWWMIWNGLWSARSADDERTWVTSPDREDLAAMTPDLVLNDGEWWLYVQCPGVTSICVARLDDTGSWQLVPGPVVRHGRSPSVIRLPDGTWRMYYVDDGSAGLTRARRTPRPPGARGPAPAVRPRDPARARRAGGSPSPTDRGFDRPP